MSIYRFFEWQGAADGYGAYGFAPWDRIHKGPGQYDWSFIDNWLAKQGGKRKAFAIATHLSQLDGWESFADCTPAWVYDGMNRPTLNGRPVGKVVTANGKTAAVPYYNDQTRWWKYLAEFVAAFGARYDGAFDAIFAGPGLDIENQPDKAPFFSGQDHRFGQLCLAYSDWHRGAFTRTPVFVVVSCGQGRRMLAEHAAGNGQGVKHNGGFIHDLDSWQGYDNYVGSWDAMQWAADNGVPTWVESAYGFMDARKRWWAIYSALHYHPVAVDIHSGLLDKLDAEQTAFIRAHTNVAAQTAPSAWCVLRDMEYPVQRWTPSDGKVYGCSGHAGDWQFYLRRTSPDADAPRVEDVGPSDAPESRQSRRITEATFEVDAKFAPPPYRLSIRWLDEDERWLGVDDQAETLHGTGSNTWLTAEYTITERRFMIEGDGMAVHSLTVEPIPGEPEPPEPPIELPPPVDWAPMLAEVDAIQAEASEIFSRRAALQDELYNLENASNRLANRLAALRGLMQRAAAE